MNWPDLGSGVYRQHGRHGRFVLGRWDQQGPRAGPAGFSLTGGGGAALAYLVGSWLRQTYGIR